MYHLLITADPEAWSGAPYDFELARFGEYTAADLVERFNPRTAVGQQAAANMPALFAFESFRDRPARVGRIKRVRLLTSSVRVDYEFFEDMPAVPASKLQEAAWALDIGNWELNRTHWAIKNLDLGEALASVGLSVSPSLAASNTDPVATTKEGTLLVRPRVFAVQDVPLEPDLVSVMMPFRDNFIGVYNAIQQACADAGAKCQRVDEVWGESAIIQDIFNLIRASKVVVVDFTGMNGNVMYETGIAHTLGCHVVPISQNAADVPFDLKHHRYLEYQNTLSGLQEMRHRLSHRLGALLRQER